MRSEKPICAPLRLSDVSTTLSLKQLWGVQFKMVLIYALGKAHMRSTPSLSRFHNVVFETVMGSSVQFKMVLIYALGKSP